MCPSCLPAAKILTGYNPQKAGVELALNDCRAGQNLCNN